MKNLKTFIEFIKESIDINDINEFDNYKNIYIKNQQKVLDYARLLLEKTIV